MSCRYLTFDDRKRLQTLYQEGEQLSAIAKTLNVHIATIYRELIRGDTGEIDRNGRNGYNAELAQKAVRNNIKCRGRRKNTA